MRVCNVTSFFVFSFVFFSRFVDHENTYIAINLYTIKNV